MCACGSGAKLNAMTTNVAQQLIDEAREAAARAQNEEESMIASARQAALNASSNVSAQR